MKLKKAKGIGERSGRKGWGLGVARVNVGYSMACGLVCGLCVAPERKQCLWRVKKCIQANRYCISLILFCYILFKFRQYLSLTTIFTIFRVNFLQYQCNWENVRLHSSVASNAGHCHLLLLLLLFPSPAPVRSSPKGYCSTIPISYLTICNHRTNCHRRTWTWCWNCSPTEKKTHCFVEIWDKIEFLNLVNF